MDNNNTISVNMPTYNRKTKILKAIESVLNQKEVNLELIIVDDGSIDGTWDYLQEYANDKENIKIYKNNRSKGSSGARNTAIYYSRGKYIALMDDDDEWIDECKLYKQMKMYNDMYKHNKQHNIIISTGIRYITNRYTKNIYGSNVNIQKQVMMNNSVIWCPTVFTSKALLLAINGFDEKIPRGDDSDLYRNALVNHNARIEVMKDITTAVYANDNDRQSVKRKLEDHKKYTRYINITIDKYREEINKCNQYKTFWTYELARSMHGEMTCGSRTIAKTDIIKEYVKTVFSKYGLSAIKQILIVICMTRNKKYANK